MALRSVIDIEINDGAFKRFADMFAKYQDMVRQTPGEWKKVGDEIDAVMDKTAEGTEKVADAAGKANVYFRQTFVAISGQAAQISKVATATGTAGKFASAQASAWHGMARDARSFAGHISDATRSLLRWGALTGLISGILGGGGLFGIDRLAASAASQRRSSSGLGVTPGEEKAFDLNYGRLVDSQSLLSGVSSAMLDPQKRAALYGAGLSEGDIQGKDAAQVASAAIDSIKRLVDQTPRELLGSLAQSRRLGELGLNEQDLQRIRDRPAGEIAEYGKNFQRDAGALDLKSDQQKAWEDFKTQLSRAGAVIENTFIVGLTPLTPALTKLSEVFTQAVSAFLKNPQVAQWIDDLGGALKGFAEGLEKEDINAKISIFVGSVEQLGKKALEFGNAVSDLTGGITGITSFVKDQYARTIKDFTDMVESLTNAWKTIAGPWITGNPATDDEAARWQREHPGQRIPTQEEQDAKPWWQGGSLFGKEPRGIRNNNPLNLSYAGQAGTVGSDGRFGVYGDMESGIAASSRQLLAYQDRDHLNTVQGIVGKWAPASENDTASYAREVSGRLHVAPTDTINLHNQDTLKELIAAMARRETGREISPDAIDRGVTQGVTGQRPMTTAGNQTVKVEIQNNTGGNAIVSANQLMLQ